MRANVCSASRICTAARLDLRLKPRPILGPSSMRCWMTLMHCRVAGPPPLAACAGVVRKVRAEGGGGGGGDAKITYMGPPGGPTRCKRRERVRRHLLNVCSTGIPLFLHDISQKMGSTRDPRSWSGSGNLSQSGTFCRLYTHEWRKHTRTLYDLTYITPGTD